MEERLLKILKSLYNNKDSIKCLKDLLGSDILLKEEKNICNDLLSQIEIQNHIDLPKVLEKYDIETEELSKIQAVPFSEVIEEMDKLITERKEQASMKKIEEALEEMQDGNYSKQALDAFFHGYVESIHITEDDTFEQLCDPSLPEKVEYISSANKYIDKFIGGIPKGSITTLVGNNDICKSVWALNIAYKCLKDAQNVLYISVGTQKREIYKRFLSRHSCDRKFEQAFNIDNLENLKEELDEGNYKKVYTDFQNFFVEHLIVYDDEEFCIKSKYSLEKLLAYAQNEFMNKTEKGIDVIIIDDFSNMYIDNGKKTITRKNEVISTYYNCLKYHAHNLLGTYNDVAIITTISAAAFSFGLLDNNYDFSLDYVDVEAKTLSDNIFSIYGNEFMSKDGNLLLKVLQSKKKVMKESKPETVDYLHWHLKYADRDNDDETQKDEDLKELQKENEQLAEENISLNQQAMDILLGRQQNNQPLSDTDVSDLFEWG